jgi:DNA-binding LytR/AlgR family response regulator
MEALLAQLAQRLPGGGARPREYLRWVQASVGATLRVIPTTDILSFRAEDKYTRVRTAGFEALIRKPIKELVEELDPGEFWQIHRAIVIRVDAVEQVGRAGPAPGTAHQRQLPSPNSLAMSGTTASSPRPL